MRHGSDGRIGWGLGLMHEPTGLRLMIMSPLPLPCRVGDDWLFNRFWTV